jgi:hypothetical protein
MVIEPIFDRLRELLAPFGFDVMLVTDPPAAGTRWTFSIRHHVRANCRLKDKVFGFNVAYTEAELVRMRDGVRRDLPDMVFRQVMDQMMAAVRDAVPGP